jgi:F0F1-type ATP synthase membrane subunit b/b'
MTAASLIPGLQSDALAREIEQQLKAETTAILATAEKDAAATVAQARKTARGRLHEAIAELRREGEMRLARAHAQLDSELRTQAQRQSARAVADTMPLLREALQTRWQEPKARQEWTAAIAQQAAKRLQRGDWQVAHPADWSAAEQKDFADAVGGADGIAFQADKAITAGLRIAADQATLDATPDGLLADSRTIAALLLDELTKGANMGAAP